MHVYAYVYTYLHTYAYAANLFVAYIPVTVYSPSPIDDHLEVAE